MISYKRMPRRTIVVEMSRKYISIAYRKKERNKVLANKGLSINKI